MSKRLHRLITITIVFSSLVIVGGCRKESVTILFRNEIENAIAVKGLENKFVTRVRFGGAGGLGAPAIYCYSADQFIDLVPPNEPIYITAEICDTYHDETFKRVYWAFLENRAGIIVYEDVYYCEEPSRFTWEVESYTDKDVTFTT